MKKIVMAGVISAVLLGAGAVAGCNTIKGAGQDVQAAGSAVSNTAEKVKDDISK